MRIVTTFNDDYYRASGKAMLDTVHRFLPQAEVLVYEELEREQTAEPSVRVSELPELKAVYENNRDIIPRAMGGSAGRLEGFNSRWFGWFRKVVAQYDAMTRNTYDGYTIFLDTDTRIVAGFTDDDVASHLTRPVGVLKGLRKAIEAGVIVYDGRAPLARQFAERFMELFLSGEFRRLEHWDDAFVMTHCMTLMPEAVQDFAQGITPTRHVNSNGHSSPKQILPHTIWGRYIEHDKGLHWQSGMVPKVSRSKNAKGRLIGKLLHGIGRLSGLS